MHEMGDATGRQIHIHLSVRALKNYLGRSLGSLRANGVEPFRAPLQSDPYHLARQDRLYGCCPTNKTASTYYFMDVKCDHTTSTFLARLWHSGPICGSWAPYGRMVHMNLNRLIE